MSGLRFVRHARKRGIPVVIVNRGPPAATTWPTSGSTRAAARPSPLGGGPVRLRVALTLPVCESITDVDEPVDPGRGEPAQRQPDHDRERTWNGNASCVSHSSTASHQSTTARTTPHRVVRADCG